MKDRGLLKAWFCHDPFIVVLGISPLNRNMALPALQQPKPIEWASQRCNQDTSDLTSGALLSFTIKLFSKKRWYPLKSEDEEHGHLPFRFNLKNPNALLHLSICIFKGTLITSDRLKLCDLSCFMPVPCVELCYTGCWLTMAIGSELIPDPACLKPLLLCRLFRSGHASSSLTAISRAWGDVTCHTLWLVIHTLCLFLHIAPRSLQNQQSCLRDCRQPLKDSCLLSMKQDVHLKFINTMPDFAWYFNQSAFHVVCGNSYLISRKPIL